MNVWLLITILVIVSSIISIIYYYGWFRYVSLKHFPNRKLIQKYSSLPKVDKSNVVVSLAASSEEDLSMEPTILSLLDQTVKVDKIVLNVSGKPGKDTRYTKMLNVFHVGKDYGKYNNIIPCLLREIDSDTKIILVDNNKIYGQDFLETLIKQSNEFPDKCIRANGALLIKPSFMKGECVNDENLSEDWLEKYLVSETKYLKYSENYG